jgi:hypothetical protein
VNMRRTLTTSAVLALIASVVVLSAQQLSFAQVASSTNYRLQSDSINFGGGLSTSTNYRQESTGGEVATGIGTSTHYALGAGYQQMQSVYIAMTVPSDVTLAPNLPGITGGTSNGSTSVRVTTDDAAGYSLSIKAQNSPAMQKSGTVTIADYVQGANPTFSYTVTTGQASFGYSPSGPNIVQAFKDNGSLCNVGSSDTALACWAGLTTSPTIISQTTGSNHPNGASTTINFRVGIGSGASVESGLYTATTTLTALPL